jgi:hypothetical protein
LPQLSDTNFNDGVSGWNDVACCGRFDGRHHVAGAERVSSGVGESSAWPSALVKVTHPSETVRFTDSTDQSLLMFCESTYDAAADLALHRDELDRPADFTR